MAITLAATKREITGKKVKTLRREGIVPAEVYGKTADNQTVQVDAIELRAVLKEAGTTKLVSLKIENGTDADVLVKEITRAMDGRTITHAEFYAVDLNTPTSAVVPVKLINEEGCAPLGRGGIVVAGLASLEILALPTAIPEFIEVDLSIIADFSDILTVEKVVAPEGVTITSNPSTTVAAVAETRASKAAAAAEREAKLKAEEA